MNEGNEPIVQIPRSEWSAFMRELRDFRSDHADMQGRLAKILGGLAEYAAIPRPIGQGTAAALPSTHGDAQEGLTEPRKNL